MEANKNLCRVCLKAEIVVNWNEELEPTFGISYRTCYYKYTHLPEIDPYPQFLCECCSENLKRTHLFVEECLATHKILEQRYCELLNDHEERTDIDLKPAIECVFMIEQENEGETDFKEEKEIKEEFGPEVNETSKRAKKRKKVIKEDSRRVSPEKSCKAKDSVKKTKLNKAALLESSTSKGQNIVKSETQEDSEQIQQDDQQTEENDKNSKAKIKASPVMCSYCSKIISNIYYLKRHEQIHQENREREETCSKCGLKMFNKKALYIHMKIHDKNREKRFKCEFCDKSFFNRGACNVHRRIHLGQMVKCPICPKEFYRQIDLDRHTKKHHSHTPLHSTGKQTKYVVHCKECNKEIDSAKFNAHRAAHMNEPLMKCTLCEKDFFSRMSCSRHMRRVHKRGRDSYDDIITYYEKYRPRLSHVLMEQQEEVLEKK
ncbi:uncharacterized protein LOC142227964 isoform X2 [Haematobia irritans]|uniref:uncharacterized protein LOC142227964 isoform X2 n=1 Tax=Haematobia irritans TaxID=7368 RepID=UPI003F50A1CD